MKKKSKKNRSEIDLGTNEKSLFNLYLDVCNFFLIYNFIDKGRGCEITGGEGGGLNCIMFKIKEVQFMCK